MPEYVIRTVEEIGAELEQIAMKGSITHYQEFAIKMGMSPHVRNWKSHPLCRIFGHLDRQDHEYSLPFRTALVLQNGPEIPGDGFFKAIKRLRKSNSQILSASRFGSLRLL